MRLPCEHSDVLHPLCMLRRATAVAAKRADPRPCLACHNAGPSTPSSAAAARRALRITSTIRDGVQKTRIRFWPAELLILPTSCGGAQLHRTQHTPPDARTRLFGRSSGQTEQVQPCYIFCAHRLVIRWGCSRSVRKYFTDRRAANGGRSVQAVAGNRRDNGKAHSVHHGRQSTVNGAPRARDYCRPAYVVGGDARTICV